MTGTRCRFHAMSGASGDHCFGFDFYAPFRIEQGSNHHGAGGAYSAENFAVGTAYLFPVFGAGDEHAGADDVVEGGAGLSERSLDQLEYGAGLFGRREFLRTHRAGAGDMHNVADADGAGEADDGLEGGSAGDVLSVAHNLL